MSNLATALILVLQQAVPAVAQDRINAVTEDMINVVDHDYNNHVLKSDMSTKDALALLTGVIVIESGLRLDVETCKANGDGGRSIGLGQVMSGPNWEGHSRKDICANRKLQLRLALHVLDTCWSKTPAPDAALRCYAAGDASRYSSTARRELEVYKKARAAIDSLPASLPVSLPKSSQVLVKST